MDTQILTLDFAFGVAEAVSFEGDPDSSFISDALGDDAFESAR